MIKTMLFDQTSVLYDKLKLVKQKDVEFIGLVTDENVILSEITQKNPSVVLLCTGQKNNVSGLVGLVKNSLPEIKLIYLMDTYNEELVIDGIEKNVDGYLLTYFDQEKIITEIVHVSKGQFVLAGEIAKVLINEIQSRYLYKKQLLKIKLIDQGFDIKDRYVDILFLILQKHKNHEIAAKLNLSEKTIRDYVSHVYTLIGIHNRKKLVVYLEDLMRG
ncbi:LuxR C-terminal-related transcriptional regulator [Virgibacillus flavescens]|uniref:response regulator transcription factor n=1 Tax=Virgibacillus flavescens TaxID=1611422 RepID=UPI003D34D17A